MTEAALNAYSIELSALQAKYGDRVDLDPAYVNNEPSQYPEGTVELDGPPEYYAEAEALYRKHFGGGK